jgi:4-amino-4-deoxy-L-arabinose transferase-like glycosyltransferase
MARLGNDSLVALLTASAVAVFACAPIRQWRAWSLLGAICGLGALTKTTFLPVLAAIAALLLYQTWRRNIWPSQFLGFIATVLVVAGWWYVQRSLETGMLFATSDADFLKDKGGIISGLKENFSIVTLARGMPETAISFLWSGTWSFITPPLKAAIPLVALTLLIACAFLVQITPLTLGFWALAIIYPTLLFVAMGNGAGYPGYYLHSLAPVLAPIIGIAITTVARHWLTRAVFSTLLGYNVVFLFGATLMQFVYFAGCGSDGSPRFDIASASACWSDWQGLRSNLSALAYPLAAFWLAAGGAIALSFSAWASLTMANGYTGSGRAIEHGASA